MIDLRNVVEKYPECLEDSTKFKNYLKDLYPSQEDQVRIRILSDVMNCGIVNEIKSGKTDSISIAHYRTEMENKYGYSSRLVQECISKWISVFDQNASEQRKPIDEEKAIENSIIEDNAVIASGLAVCEEPPVPAADQRNKQPQNEYGAKWIIGILCLICLVVIFLLTYNFVMRPEKQYNTAVEQLNQGDYQQAIVGFEALDDYKDSADMVLETKYKWAESLLADRAYDEAYAKFEEIKDYSDAADRMKDVRYAEAEEYFEENRYQTAINLFGTLDGYKDSQAKVQEANYLLAEDYLKQEQLEEALTYFEKAGEYKDAMARATEVYEMMQVHATAVKLNKTSLTISKGKTAELSATLEPSDTTDTIVSWTSSNEKVATVDKNGVVTAVDFGNATIEVKTTNELTANCKITVPTANSTTPKSNNTSKPTPEASNPTPVTGVLADIQGEWEYGAPWFYRLTIKGNTYSRVGGANYSGIGIVLFYESGTVTVGEQFGNYHLVTFHATQYYETNESGEKLETNIRSGGGFSIHAYYSDNGEVGLTGYTRVK